MTGRVVQDSQQPAEGATLGLRLIRREKELLRQLFDLARRQNRESAAIVERFESSVDSISAAHRRRVSAIDACFHGETATVERQWSATQQRLTAEFEAGHVAIERESHETYARLVCEIEKSEKRAKRTLDEARWLAHTVFEAKRKRLKQQLQAVQKQLRAREQAARAIEQEARAWLDRFGQRIVAERLPEFPEPDPGDENLSERLLQAQATAENQLAQLRLLRLPKWVQAPGLFWISIAILVVIAPAVGWTVSWRLVLWIPITAVCATVVSVGLALWLRALARRQTRDVFGPLAQAVRDVGDYARRTLARRTEKYTRERREVRQQRDAEYARAAEAHAPTLAACQARRDNELPQIAARAAERLDQLQRQYDLDLPLATALYETQQVEIRDRHQRERAETEASLQQALLTNQAEYDQRREQLATAWELGLTAAHTEIVAIERAVSDQSRDWDEVLSDQWQAPRAIPGAIRFGSLAVDIPELLGEPIQLPGDVESPTLRFPLPAVLNFPQGSSVLVRSRQGGRAWAIELLQTLMLRMLTTVPPGNLRFTIVDPVGLGQNFAAFMHLGDYDESLVGHRIWTEPQQIEQRLADLTEHMETVIQKYLRDEFATIEAYNLQAGEIAEPFRVLVVANYPAGFNEGAARRLLSIVASGARCGVHTLISVDTKLPPIPGIDLADLERHATVFAAHTEQGVWQDAELKPLPLTIDRPPPRDAFKRILQKIGTAAAGAKRVEVPFEAIAPQPDQYWTGDSRRGIDVPLGRAGATRLQNLRLGQGTSQHVLIAGKTGSGKSTLLHALITNAALRYSPDELEMYLIDFKKGVEFKTYVTHELPHARVVAIESEREFGLSVMQRLAAEMHQRGELFRAAGVQDIAGYRDAGHRLPRVLFIVDEFQEFFVEDDKTAQEAALLLDRLVRQGRAFGIHAHLGSQTLGGAYSLARSTLGQMAVRIALQCSEADAHLILSEENSAARLLSRPGEAIYNDANGLVEGNHPFQVVWLPDERREVFLREIQRLGYERPCAARPARIVFEGTQPAELAESVDLREQMAASTWPVAQTAPRAWLGEPLAIDAATSVTFQRRSGANLLWLGQSQEAIAGMVAAALTSLAAQVPPPGENGKPQPASFWILDGSPAEVRAGHGSLSSTIRAIAGRLPQAVRLAESGQVTETLTELSAELERRQQGRAGGPPLFLFVLDLSRLRELRRRDDDFSFSRATDPGPRPDRQFAELLREGPALGIHSLVWCDTLTNFNRTLERSALREFEARVLTQMGAADSSLLIETPAASQLGRFRALLYREDEGRLEKFRPYSTPSEEWLDWVREQLLAKSVDTPAPTP